MSSKSRSPMYPKSTDIERSTVMETDQAPPYPVVRTSPGEVEEICAMDALALAERIRAREISPVEVVEAVLERQEALEPTLHAFCTPTPDLARARARRLEADLSAGREVGPLSGVPIAV